jgi:NAD(P)-dependent dehydrogenase (short-subunit alcohol dehydrogenase family)
MAHRTAVVVGGTSGIGLATARQLHDRGATVHVTGRSAQRLDTVRQEAPELLGHQADGTSHDAMSKLFASIGTVDWLVLSMGGSAGAGPLASLDLGELRGAFDAKFWGHLTSVQAALPYLAEDGSITFVGAGSARSGIPTTAGLAAVNGAVEALVKPLAVELAPIRVNAVSPGLVDTPWWDEMPADVRDAYFAAAAKALPVGRVASAVEVAESVALAATNGNLTGTVLETDGGARLVSLA